MNLIKTRYFCFLLAFLFASQAVQAMDGEDTNQKKHHRSHKQETRAKKGAKYYQRWSSDQGNNSDYAYKMLHKSGEYNYVPAILDLIALYREDGERFFGLQSIADKEVNALIYRLEEKDPVRARELRSYLLIYKSQDIRDVSRGLKLYEEVGSRDSFYNLGQIYDCGVQVNIDGDKVYAVRPDEELACLCYQKALQTGPHPQAQESLEALKERMPNHAQKTSQSPQSKQSVNTRGEKISPRSPRDTHTTTVHKSQKSPHKDTKTRKRNK